MHQPFYQEVACSTPPSPPIGIGVPCEPVPNVYSNISPQHMPHAQPSLPELQSHTYVASVPQPNSLEPSQFCKDLIDKILIECGFKPRVSLKENKIDSDMNDNSVIERAKENNTCSDSIILEDTHLAMQEHEEESEVAAINPDNAIAVTLDDLSKDRQREIERELEEERQESQQRKLVGLQKTKNGVIKKVAASDHSASPSTEVSKSLSSTKFKEVQIANTLPISQFNQVFILDKSSDYPRSSRLYVLGNYIFVNSTLSVPKSIYAFSQLRDMFHDNFATRNMKLITDKIKESDFNGNTLLSYQIMQVQAMFR
jgi:hypothetical protein